MITSRRRPRKRILFVGEGVTLAHVVRPLMLADSLDPDLYEVFFACDPRHETRVRERGLNYVSVTSIASETFLDRVRVARPLYTTEELARYVCDDLRAIAATAPDVVVGDFRLSLGTSAELCGIPCLTISNAHWSPGANLPHPVPEHPLCRILGLLLMRGLMRFMLPMFFGIQARALNRVRRGYGLEPIRGGAHAVFTHGTATLYADVPELYELGEPAESEHFIGPLNWAPSTDLPEWWNRLPDDRKTVFLTAGSSGDVSRLRDVVTSLVEHGMVVIVATAGRFEVWELPGQVFAADFISAREASKRADVVVCNGGSAMVYQALACGTPIVGIPQNMDQYYSMGAVERRGAGKQLRAGELDGARLATMVEEVLGDGSYERAAVRLQGCIGRIDAGERFEIALTEVLKKRLQTIQVEEGDGLSFNDVRRNWFDLACAMYE